MTPAELMKENQELRARCASMQKEVMDAWRKDTVNVTTCFGYSFDDLLDIIEKHENGN